MRAAILTVSDLGARGEREDTAGPAVATMLASANFDVVEQTLLADEPDQIAAQLSTWADGDIADLALTVGGTGLSPRDRTPQATEQVIEYRVDGLVQAMHAAGLASTPMAMLSRAVAGVRATMLIINLPGSERGARENLDAVLPVLTHAVEQLRDGSGH